MLGILPGHVLHLADYASVTLGNDRAKNMAATVPQNTPVVADPKP